jgi:predicted AAA+ superfamily ATPase
MDLEGGTGRFILTGSQQFLLMAGITQSLAGRIATFHLYPFTVAELAGYPPDKSPESIFSVKPGRIPSKPVAQTSELVWKGLYPRIHDKRLEAGRWLEEYIQTYVERDVRSLSNVGDLRSFESFIKACATQTGQLLNLNALASSVGVSAPTSKRWVSLLETSGLIFLLQPYHRNFRKRLVKTPKLYFVDTGLACRLLSIRTPEDLRHHPSMVPSSRPSWSRSFISAWRTRARISPLHFFRDKLGSEVDLIVDFGGEKVIPVEIKSTRTYSEDLSASVQNGFLLAQNGPAAWSSMTGHKRWASRRLCQRCLGGCL